VGASLRRPRGRLVDRALNPGPLARDFADFLDSDRGEDFFRGAWGWFAVVVVLAVFNTVLGEELLFRGLLLPRMQRVFGGGTGSPTAALFAVYHLHQRWVIPTTLVEGIFLEAYPFAAVPERVDGDHRALDADPFFIVIVLTLVLD